MDSLPTEMLHLRFRLKSLLVIVAVVALICAYCVRLRTSAEREYAAYRKLSELGAEGEDWTSPKELITGRPPIVRIWIPAAIDSQVAMPLLGKLNNLEALTLEYDKLTPSDLHTLDSMSLRSITFLGEFPTDDDIEELLRFDTVTFLTLPADQLHDRSISLLRESMPLTILKFRNEKGPSRFIVDE